MLQSRIHRPKIRNTFFKSALSFLPDPEQIILDPEQIILDPDPQHWKNALFCRKIVRQGGAIGLWRGCWPNVQRAALVNLGDLSTYDRNRTGRQSFNKKNSSFHLIGLLCIVQTRRNIGRLCLQLFWYSNPRHSMLM